jgi:hypothetical protein
MRFRQRFAWIQFIGAVLWLYLSYGWVNKPHNPPGFHSAYMTLGAVWFLQALFCVLSYYFVWWDIGESGLTERRLLSTKTIPWTELTRVGPWVTGKRRSMGMVEVEYYRSAPMSDSGHFLLQPKKDERKDLFSQLCHYAPQATFEWS